MIGKVHLVLLCFFCCVIGYGLSQQRSKSYGDILYEYKQANAIYTTALKQANEQEEERLNKAALVRFKNFVTTIPATSGFDSLRFFSFLKLGSLYHYFDSLSNALHYYRLAIQTKRKLPSLADSFVFKPYLFSGNIYFAKNEMDSAFASYKQAETILSHQTVKLEESERLYNTLGVLYYQSGNFRQAKNYFRKAVEVLPANHPYYQNLYVNYNINFASVLVKLRNYDTAYAIYQKLLPYKEYANEIRNNMGLIRFYLNEPQKALNEFGKIHYNNRLDIGLYNDRANAWLLLNKIDSAKASVDKAIALNAKYNKAQTSTDYGLSLKIFGTIQKQQQQYRQALQLYQKAIHQFYPSYTDYNFLNNPEKFSGVFSYIHLFETLVAKAACFHAMYQQEHKEQWAKEELKVYDAAFRLIDYIETTYDSDEARLFLGERRYEVHEKPIDVAYELYRRTGDFTYAEQAYEFDQKNKASVLVFNEQQNQYGKPASAVRQKEKELKTAITRLSLQAAQTVNEADREQLNDRIGDLEMQLGKVQNKIAATYNAAGAKVPSIPFLQKNFLDAQTQLLSFHLTKTKLSVFSIEQSKAAFFQKDLYPQFYNDLDKFIKNLHVMEYKSDADSVSQRLYHFLLGSVLSDKCKRLLIIADDELNYLPFEALQQEAHYLIENYSVQYQYSTALLQQQKIDFPKAKTLALAPFAQKSFSNNSNQFPQLINSLQEAEGTNGKIYSGDKADKKTLLQHIPDYDIIHLATHAVSNDSAHHLSYIAFAPWDKEQVSDYLLYAQEIYNLPLKNTKLVVLSACETGSGDLVNGEGVMSLSRAFAYAGCANTIASFWKADDASTAYITQKFYAYLSNGMAIDEALQKAKLDYLKRTDINPRLKQPAYWAHLVFVGNYTPHKKKHTVLWIGIALIVCGGFWLLIKRKKRT